MYVGGLGVGLLLEGVWVGGVGVYIEGIVVVGVLKEFSIFFFIFWFFREMSFCWYLEKGFVFGIGEDFFFG